MSLQWRSLVARLTTRGRLIAGFTLILAILVGSNALALQRLSALEKAERAAPRGDAVVTPCRGCLLAKAMANDERGFLLTGDKEFRRRSTSATPR
jgi:CHASE3 domain sensor protein